MNLSSNVRSTSYPSFLSLILVSPCCFPHMSLPFLWLRRNLLAIGSFVLKFYQLKSSYRVSQCWKVDFVWAPCRGIALHAAGWPLLRRLPTTRKNSSPFFSFLKYVVTEVWPTSLIGPVACPSSEPSGLALPDIVEQFVSEAASVASPPPPKTQAVLNRHNNLFFSLCNLFFTILLANLSQSSCQWAEVTERSDL